MSALHNSAQSYRLVHTVPFQVAAMKEAGREKSMPHGLLTGLALNLQVQTKRYHRVADPSSEKIAAEQWPFVVEIQELNESTHLQIHQIFRPAYMYSQVHSGKEFGCSADHALPCRYE